MIVNPFDLSQPVENDQMYEVQHSQVRPSFQVRLIERGHNLEKFYGSSYFSPGRHYCIIHSHFNNLPKEMDVAKINDLIESLEWDIQYFQVALGKLTFDVHQEAIQILTKHIAKDKLLLEQARDRKHEIKRYEWNRV